MLTNVHYSWGVHYAGQAYQYGIMLVVSLEDSSWAPIFGILLVLCWSVLQYLLTRLFEESLYFGLIDIEGRIILATGFNFLLRVITITLVLNLSTFNATWWTVMLFDSLQTILALGGVQDKILTAVVRWLRQRRGRVARKLVEFFGDQSMLVGDRLVHISANWNEIDRKNMETAMHVIIASSTMFQEILVYVVAFVMLSTEFALVRASPFFVPLWNYHHLVHPWTNRSSNGTSFHGEASAQIKVICGFALLVAVECCNAFVVYVLLAWDVYPLRQSAITHGHDSDRKLLRQHSSNRRFAIEAMASKKKHRTSPGNEDAKSGSLVYGSMSNATRRDLVDELSSRELLARVVISNWDMHVFPTQVLERHWKYVLVLFACGICQGLVGAAYMNSNRLMQHNYGTDTLYMNETLDYRVMKFEEFISVQIGRNYSDVSSVKNVQCIRDLSFCRWW